MEDEILVVGTGVVLVSGLVILRIFEAALILLLLAVCVEVLVEVTVIVEWVVVVVMVDL